MPALGPPPWPDPRDSALTQACSLPPTQGLSLPATKSGALCEAGAGLCWAEGEEVLWLPGNLLSWHLLLPGYQGDVLNAALKIQNTDSSSLLAQTPALPPFLFWSVK